MEYQDIILRLQKVYDLCESRALARMILNECFGMTLTDIACGKVTELSGEEGAELEKIIVRLEKSEPIQYILGYATFCNRAFHVAPGVLIPRPETEDVVTAAYEIFREEKSMRKLLDIGTGSGCIAITLTLMAKEGGRDVSTLACDVSTLALATAKRNAARHDVEIFFEKRDILFYTAAEREQWDIIVSNPPYICMKERESMERNVLDYEPHGALFVPDTDPLLFYRHIARFGTETLTPRGALVFEINKAYASETCSMLHDMGYSDVRIVEDRYGNPRIVTARKPSELSHHCPHSRASLAYP